jgi:hypothetical protein
MGREDMARQKPNRDSFASFAYSSLARRAQQGQESSVNDPSVLKVFWSLEPKVLVESFGL